MLTIEKPLLDQLVDHLQSCYPLEGCGLLAGKPSGLVTAVYPIDNILKSPTAYKMDPRQQVKAMVELEAKGWRLLAIYHSHPQGPTYPSPTDIAQAYYPESATLIVSLQEAQKPTLRAFTIVGQEVAEETVKIV